MADRAAGPETAPRSMSRGFGRILVAVYAVFAVSATGRSVAQLATKASEAPLAYGLSAFAAIVYVVATLALARDHWRLALVSCLIELVGVLVVGTLTVTEAAAFPDATVWSDYGAGYGWFPLVLPFVGLGWLLRTRPQAV